LCFCCIYLDFEVFLFVAKHTFLYNVIFQVFNFMSLMHTHTHMVHEVLDPVTAELVRPPCFNNRYYVRANISLKCQLPSSSSPPTLSLSWHRLKDSTVTSLRVRTWVVGNSLQGAAPPVDVYAIESLGTLDEGTYFCRVDNGVLSQESSRISVSPVLSTYVCVSRWKYFEYLIWAGHFLV